VALVHQNPKASGGVFLVTVVAALFACFRLYGAIFSNHRYRFTSWWVARFLALLFLAGLVMKLALWALPAVQ